MVHQHTLSFRTRGRGTTDITAEVAHARSVVVTVMGEAKQPGDLEARSPDPG